MDDLISRELALKESYKIVIEGEVFDVVQVESLLGLPSAEPERKKGEWVYDGIRGRFPACKCSICGHYENADWTILQGANFCPHCGADMRGDHE